MKDVLKVVLVLGKLYLGIGYGFSFCADIKIASSVNCTVIFGGYGSNCNINIVK